MIICLLSDLHLELADNPDFIIYKASLLKGDILILCGDIGDPFLQSYRKLLNSVYRNFYHVLVISGNHEYFQHYKRIDNHNLIVHNNGQKSYTTDEVDIFIDSICESFDNVHFLQRKCFIYKNMKFLGCTLWSLGDEKFNDKVNDFKYIPELQRTELFHTNVSWLNKELNDNRYINIVLTHHLPSYLLIDEKYKNSKLNSFYANNLEYLINKANVWCCGHSHTAKNMKIGSTYCYVNPYGYNGEETGFDINLIIDPFRN